MKEWLLLLLLPCPPSHRSSPSFFLDCQPQPVHGHMGAPHRCIPRAASPWEWASPQHSTAALFTLPLKKQLGGVYWAWDHAVWGHLAWREPEAAHADPLVSEGTDQAGVAWLAVPSGAERRKGLCGRDLASPAALSGAVPRLLGAHPRVGETVCAHTEICARRVGIQEIHVYLLAEVFLSLLKAISLGH